MRTETVSLDRVTILDDGIPLLNDISLRIFEGEIMGLISINAYGQETFIHLLRQNIPIHYGRVYFREKLVNSYKRSPLNYNKVAVIEKNSCLVESLSVADNIFVLRRGFHKFRIDSRTLEKQLEPFIEKLDFPVDASVSAGGLSPFEKCAAELLKAVVTGAHLVILRDIGDNAAHIDKLHKLIRRCAARGVSVLYISGHHEEVFSICDRAALMENGGIRYVLSRKDFHMDIVGSVFSAEHRAQDLAAVGKPPARQTALELRHVFTEKIIDFNMTVNAGECVMVFDEEKTALDDLCGVITGVAPPTKGCALLEGRPITGMGGRDICVIAENPIHTMLFHSLTYIENLCFFLERRVPLLWFDRRIIESVKKEYETLIGPDIHSQDIAGLSAFSLYNLVYYRVHLLYPKVVVCVNPFAGVDMSSRYHIKSLIHALQARGTNVVVLTTGRSDMLNAPYRVILLNK